MTIWHIVDYGHNHSVMAVHPVVTAEMIDTGLWLKRSFELTEAMAETWLSRLLVKIDYIGR